MADFPTESGGQAFRWGQPLGDNPYAVAGASSDDWEAWRQGWFKAKRDQELEPMVWVDLAHGRTFVEGVPTPEPERPKMCPFLSDQTGPRKCLKDGCQMWGKVGTTPDGTITVVDCRLVVSRG